MAWIVGIGVFLFLLFAFPRQMGALLLGAIILIGAVIWYAVREDEKRDQERNRVQLVARYDEASCGKDHPIAVTYHNGSGRTLVGVWFNLRGKEPGRSSPVYDASLNSDRIVGAGESLTDCWSIPPADFGISESRLAALPPESALWQADINYPSFGGTD